jgi:putative heme iron utilization protein
MTEERPIAGARRLLRASRFASLATIIPSGGPFVSLVSLATDLRGRPILLLSDLARHSTNLAADARISLLLDDTASRVERLTGERLTLIGSLAPCKADETMRRCYLAQHPSAEMLLGMADFRFYRMEVDAGHQVAGFGRIDAIDAGELLVDVEIARGLAAIEASAIAHMADDHRDALELLAGQEGLVTLQVIDADGLVLVSGGRSVRVMFQERLGSAAELRTAIAKVVRQIRRNSEQIVDS